MAVTAALAIGLSGIIGSTDGRGTIRTAAFTLISNANGTATLTINPEVLLDPSTLQSDLKQDGIPAMVTVGSFCSSDPPPAGFLRVVSFQPKRRGSRPHQPVADLTVTFNPSAMPAGTELSFGNFQLANGQQTLSRSSHWRLHLHQHRAHRSPTPRRDSALQPSGVVMPNRSL